MNWYFDVLKKYAVFTGRARRQEFWMYVLVNFIISFVLGMLSQVADFLVFLVSIYGLAVFIPSLAVAIRRMHDIGRSGIWLLIAFVPCIGWIWLIILYCKEGDPAANAYGPSPK